VIRPQKALQNSLYSIVFIFNYIIFLTRVTT